MPRTVITVQTTQRTSDGLDIGTAMAAADQANGMEFANSQQNVILYVYNGDASGKTVTITTVTTTDELELPDLTVAVAAGERRFVGPFKNGTYGSGNGQTVYVDFDSDTSVTVAAFKAGTI